MPTNISKNTFLIVLSRIINKIIIAITYFLIARYLGVALFGDFSTVVAYVTLFIIFTELGMRDFLIRELSRASDKRGVYLGNSIFLVVTFSIIIFVAMITTACWLGYSRLLVRLIVLFGVAMIINSITNIYIFGLYDALQRFGLSVLIDTGSIVFRFALIVLSIFLNLGINGIIFSYLLSCVFGLGTVLLVSFVAKIEIPRIDFNLIRGMLVKAAPFFIVHIFYLCIGRCGILMLSLMKTATEVGFYSAAYKIFEAIIFISVAFSRIFAPTLYTIDLKNSKKLKSIFNIGVRYGALVGLPLTVASIFMAGSIITFLYSQQYRGSIVVLMIISPAIIFYLLVSIFERFIIAVDRIKKFAAIMGIGAGVNIILNFILIPQHGAIGASIAMVVTATLLAIMQYKLISDIVHGYFFVRASKITSRVK